MNICKDKLMGCIIGGAIGDAIGNAYEGQQPHDDLTMDMDKEWFLTDDTQLTLATCEGITETPEPDPSIIASRYCKWFCEGRITSIGSSTLKALKDLMLGAHWALSGRTGDMSAGNGAAMRIAPLAFCLDPETDKGKLLIRDISSITHKNDEAYAAALSVCLAVYYGITGKWSTSKDLLRLITSNTPDSNIRDTIQKLHSSNIISIAEASQITGVSGYAPESVSLAIYASSMVRNIHFADILFELVSCGGDTDTIASIAGQIMGAKIGFSEIPATLVQRIPNLDFLFYTIENFATARNC